MSTASAALARRTATSAVFTAFLLKKWLVMLSSVGSPRHQCKAQFSLSRAFASANSGNIRQPVQPVCLGLHRTSMRRRFGQGRHRGLLVRECVQASKMVARKRSGGTGRLNAISPDAAAFRVSNPPNALRGRRRQQRRSSDGSSLRQIARAARIASACP